MRILCTGGAGFIGSHLCERLLSDGHDVMAIDDLSSGRRENLAKCGSGKPYRWEGRAEWASFDFHFGDVAERVLVEHLVKNAHFVFHLAATVGVFQYMQHPVQTVLNNIEGTATVLKLCAEHEVPCLIASTSEVYGKTNKLPFHEDDDIVFGPSVKPRWAYAASKYADELLALGYHRQYGLLVRIVRLFNVVGPRQTGRYGMVVPRFIQQTKAGQPMTVFDTGDQTRTFCSVHDVADGLVAMMGCEAAIGKVVNLGSEKEISINQLAAEVGYLVCGTIWNAKQVPYSEAYGEGFDETPRRVPDLTRARELIGWKPKWSLGDILKELVEGD